MLDLGCGGGDMLEAAHNAGATVKGIDNDPRQASITKDRLFAAGAGFAVTVKDITNLPPMPHDIITCFSVLPYIERPAKLLSWIAANSEIALIEVQYVGDGPGVVHHDQEMAYWLYDHWAQAAPIGRTLVDYRRVWRTIWLCR